MRCQQCGADERPCDAGSCCSAGAFRQRPTTAAMRRRTRQLADQQALHVGANLARLAAPRHAHVCDASHLLGEAHAAAGRGGSAAGAAARSTRAASAARVHARMRAWRAEQTWCRHSTARDRRAARRAAHRVQWMQRVITVLTSGPRFLSSTVRLTSTKRERSLPNTIAWRGGGGRGRRARAASVRR